MSNSPQRWWGSSGGSPASRGPQEEAGSSRREENDAAELVLEQLDEQWFRGNVVRWSLSSSSSRPGSPTGKDSTTSPFRPCLASLVKPRPVGGVTRFQTRRLSDGDHQLRRYLDRGPRNAPETPPRKDRYEASGEVFPPAGPLMGVTEDEELENDLFAKMLANRPAKLTTINPGRLSSAARGPLQENTNHAGVVAKPRPQRRRLKGTKSLTDLEYEELRGLKDLGFEVSKDDLTPHVVRMFPGLQGQGIPPYNSPQRQGQPPNLQNVTTRFPPVQQLLWPRRPDSPLTNAPLLDPSIDMKGQLKSWASEMASIVSIEC